MKKVYYIFAILMCVMVLSSCTHNNGDIGNYFGTWKLQEIAIDGEKDTAYEGNVFWKFQNQVISMVRVNEVLHSTSESFGTWSEVDSNVLILDFSHSDDNHVQGSSFYSPLPETYLPKGQSQLSIVSQTSTQMHLSYLDADGREIGYMFKKW